MAMALAVPLLLMVGAVPAWAAAGNVDRSTGEIVATSPTFSQYNGYEPPFSLAVSSDGSAVYVMGDELVAFDPVTLQKKEAPQIFGAEGAIALSPDGTTLYYGSYVETENDDDFRTDLHALSLSTGEERVVQIEGASLTQIAVSVDGGRVYVAAFNGGIVSQIDTASWTVTGSLEAQPSAILVHPDGWVIMADYSGLIAVEPESMVASIWDSTAGDANRFGLAVTSDGSKLFAAANDDTLALYDPRTLQEQATMEVADLRVPTVSAGDERLFVGRKGTVVVIDLVAGELQSKIPTQSDNLTYSDIAAHPSNPDLFYAVIADESSFSNTRLVLIDVSAPRTAPFPWWIVGIAGGLLLFAVAAVVGIRMLRNRRVRSRPALKEPVALEVQQQPNPEPTLAPSLDPATAAAASNPLTDLEVLASIAYDVPEARHLVAANPSAYEGLLEWLAEFDDPRIVAALAERKED